MNNNSTKNETTEPVVLTERIALPNNPDRTCIIITLNRPDSLNCFSTAVCHDLAKIFQEIHDELQNDAAKNNKQTNLAAVILTGNGPAFCAGADLTDPPNPLVQSSDLWEHLQCNPVHFMDRCGVPIIGAVHGYCITGGFELALACDILVGDDSTKFKDTHVKFGLAPCWGLSQKLQRRVGPGRAKWISFSATTVRAQQALDWGLLNEIVSANESTTNGNSAVLTRAVEMADEIAKNDTVMVRRYKRALVEGGEMDLMHGLQRERELGISHYLEVMNDGSTFEGAKEFITSDSRPRSRL